jgi:hypothetical protein
MQYEPTWPRGSLGAYDRLGKFLALTGRHNVLLPKPVRGLPQPFIDDVNTLHRALREAMEEVRIQRALLRDLRNPKGHQ